MIRSLRGHAVRNVAACEASWKSTKGNNAFITPLFDSAREIASGNVSGPLAGVPYSLKDNFSTAGIRTTCASAMLADYIPTYNSTVYERLSGAGAILVGKTNMDEFGMGSLGTHSHFGPVLNPKDPLRSAGGSSSGSAAAVASGASAFSIGSDTGGSVRLPASYCGVVGFKPSYGALSRWGMVAYASSLDCPSVMATSVEDVEEVFNVLAEPDVHDQRTVQWHTEHKSSLSEAGQGRRVTIGIPREYLTSDLAGQVADLWESAIHMLGSSSDAVADVVPVDLPHTKYALPTYYVIALAEASSNLAKYDGLKYGHRSSTSDDAVTASRTEAFGQEVQNRILMGTFSLSEKYFDSYFMQATHVRSLISRDFKKVYESGVDFILCPTASGVAPLLSEAGANANKAESFLNDVFTVPASLAGLAAISVPFYKPGTLPIGLQLVGAAGAERGLFRIASVLQQLGTRL